MIYMVDEEKGIDGNLYWKAVKRFKFHFFEKFFQEYHQSVKLFGSRSGLTLCWA